MDVVLINSPLYDAGRKDTAYADPPPLGLGYIGTALRQQGHDVELIDAVAAGLSVGALVCKLDEARPNVIGLNVFSTNLQIVERVVSELSCTAQILVGGPAAGHLFDKILSWHSHNPITVIVGEADHAVSALLDGKATPELWQGNPARSVLRIDPKNAWFPASIDLPLDRSLLQMEPVFEPHWDHWEAHIVTSRGCGHDCAFCGAARSVNPGQKIRFRSENHIAQELDDILTAHPMVRCVRVLDDLFLRNPTFIERAVRLFAARSLRWRAMAHVAGLAGGLDHVFNRLASSGCVELFVGVESGSPQRRSLIGKPDDLIPTIRIIEGLLQVGIDVKAYFVFGFPGETETEMLATYTLASQMAAYAAKSPGCFRASAFKFRPYHGTRLYDELVIAGRSPRLISEDYDLSELKGGRAYDFASENFSAVSTDRLNQIILNTTKVNS